MGGGGDGGFQAAQAEMEAKKRQARNAVNVLFGVDARGADGKVLGGNKADMNRDALNALYKQTRADAFTAGKRGVLEDRDQAQRDLRFELFARGLNGGSVDVDQNALLGREYTDALTQLGSKADALKTGFKANDEQTRLGLLQSIDAGMDQGSAVSSALAQMSNNASKAAAEAQGMDLGDLFTNAALLYNRNRRAQGEASAAQWWQQNSGTGKVPSSVSSGLTSWAG